MTDFVQRVLDHVLGTPASAIPASAYGAAKRYYLDTLGVGLAGARAPLAARMLAAASRWGSAVDGQPAASLWGDDRKLPATSAAYLNAFQIHCQEYDCVHEPAVVHPLATIGAALTAEAEAQGEVHGEAFLAALVLAVDIAASLGVAVTSPIRFFRPATAGLFGATLGIARLRGLHEATARDALGYALAQAAGTMQAHVEGKPALPVQIAAAARASIQANDLAEAGMTAAHDVFEGPYGYFPLFEETWSLDAVAADLGRVWRIEDVSYKPFPTGRAAQGGLPMVQSLYEQGIRGGDIASLVLTAPPLIERLVGRPAKAGMDANYARLCFPYLAAVMLRDGSVGLSQFSDGVLSDDGIHATAAQIRVVSDEGPDPAAFVPQRLDARLNDGRNITLATDRLYGAPGNLMSPEAAHRKLTDCLGFAGSDDPAGHADALRNAIENLNQSDSLADVLSLVRMQQDDAR